MPTAIENNHQFVEELMKQEPPRFVYKYCRFDENTYTNLNEKQLWFSDPKKYNDPFDSRLINPPQLYSSDDIREYDKGRALCGLVDDRDAVGGNLEFNEQDPTKWAKELNDNINQTLMAVCCFSKDQNNILMWSHYADGHKGLCLEFDTHENKEFFTPTRFRSVKYSNECISDNYLQDEAKTLHNMICTKAKCWEPENEVRVMILNQREGLRKYNDRTLKSVTFGCRATLSNIKLTIRILGASVEYKRCELDETKRELVIVPLLNYP